MTSDQQSASLIRALVDARNETIRVKQVLKPYLSVDYWPAVVPLMLVEDL